MKKALLWRATILLVCAAVLASIFLAVAVFFVTTATGQSLDQRAFNGAFLGQRTVGPVALTLLDALPITGVAVAVVLAILVTIVRRNWWVLVAALVTAGVANIATQAIKNVFLERPDLGVVGYAVNSLPSGHTTLAASAALIVFLVSSQRTRPMVSALGALFATSIGVSTLANQWHRPSDVVAAFLLVSLFGCLAGFVLIWFRFTDEAPKRDLLSRLLLLLALPCAGLALLTVFVSGFSAIAYIGSAAGIATVALLLAAGANHAFRFLR
ncbi:MAG: phosphatase PAP2 family protein [Terrimesophilobacter sp.]